MITRNKNELKDSDTKKIANDKWIINHSTGIDTHQNLGMSIGQSWQWFEGAWMNLRLPEHNKKYQKILLLINSIHITFITTQNVFCYLYLQKKILQFLLKSNFVTSLSFGLAG